VRTLDLQSRGAFCAIGHREPARTRITLTSTAPLRAPCSSRSVFGHQTRPVISHLDLNRNQRQPSNGPSLEVPKRPCEDSTAPTVVKCRRNAPFLLALPKAIPVPSAAPDTSACCGSGYAAFPGDVRSSQMSPLPGPVSQVSGIKQVTRCDIHTHAHTQESRL